jgi:hypothetical protein
MPSKDVEMIAVILGGGPDDMVWFGCEGQVVRRGDESMENELAQMHWVNMIDSRGGRHSDRTSIHCLSSFRLSANQTSSQLVLHALTAVHVRSKANIGVHNQVLLHCTAESQWRLPVSFSPRPSWSAVHGL